MSKQELITYVLLVDANKEKGIDRTFLEEIEDEVFVNKHMLDEKLSKEATGEQRICCYTLTEFMDAFNNQDLGHTDNWWMGYVRVFSINGEMI